MKHISIIVLPRALGSTVTIPLEMLSAANDIARARRQRDKLLTLELVSTQKGEVILSGGLAMNCSRSLAQVTQTNLIFIPGIWGNPRACVNKHNLVVSWLQQQYEAGATLCAITTGAFFVAEAGLLNGKAGTTHWRFFDQFQHDYPRVKLQRKRFITSVDNIYCTGSVNAARDIMLHFIELLFGESISTLR